MFANCMTQFSLHIYPNMTKCSDGERNLHNQPFPRNVKKKFKSSEFSPLCHINIDSMRLTAGVVFLLQGSTYHILLFNGGWVAVGGYCVPGDVIQNPQLQCTIGGKQSGQSLYHSS